MEKNLNNNMDLILSLAFILPFAFFAILLQNHIKVVQEHSRRALKATGVTAPKKCAVVGAGISGLAMARELIKRGCEVEIFESSDKIGGVWSNESRMYTSLRCNVPKQYMTLIDVPAEASDPTYQAPKHVLNYITNFAKSSDLLRYVKLCCKVVQLIRNPDDTWTISFTCNGEQKNADFDCVVIAQGQTNDSYVPAYSGLENFSGISIHSSEFRNSSIFVGKKVLVVGEFSSGCDIVQDVSFSAEEVFLSCRRPFISFIPRFTFGIPFVETIKSKACYHFPWFEKFIIYLVGFGGIFRSGFFWSKNNHLNQVRDPSCEKFAYPSHFVADSNDLAMRCAIGAIQVRGPIKEIRSKSVLFSDGNEQLVDAIIWATGYSRNFQSPIFEHARKKDDGILLYDFAICPGVKNFAFLLPQHPTGPHWPVISIMAEYIAKIFTSELELPDEEAQKKEALFLGRFQGNVDTNTGIEVRRFGSRLGRRPPSLLELFVEFFISPRRLYQYLTFSDWGHVLEVADTEKSIKVHF